MKYIWQEVGSFLNFGISWKILVLRFHYENNVKIRRFNYIMSFIIFSIYKYKISCRINYEKLEKNLARAKEIVIRQPNSMDQGHNHIQYSNIKI